NTQPGDLDHEFVLSVEGKSNYRRVRGAAGDQRAAVPLGDASADFPIRGDNGLESGQIIGEDGRQMPPLGSGHVEIVVNSCLGDNGISFVREPVDVIIVAVIPK